MDFPALLKQYLLNQDKKKVYTTPERFAWFKSHNTRKAITPPPPPPPPKMAPQPKAAPPPPQKSAFKLNPKKENQVPDAKSLLNQLKNSIEGVTFFEEPVVPKKKEVVVICTEEERPLLEKLVQAIDQKILPCRFGDSGEIEIVSPSANREGVYTLPPAKNLEDLAVKQQVWKELKACLSKYC